MREILLLTTIVLGLNNHRKKQQTGLLGQKEHIKKWKMVDGSHDPSLPEQQDLRSKQPGCIEPVVSQGQCGSCWAFAVTHTVGDTLSIQRAKANGSNKCDKWVELSQTDLIYCSGSTPGGQCDGGQIHTALEYVSNTGVASLKCMPQGLSSGGADQLGQNSCPNKCKQGKPSNRAEGDGNQVWIDTAAKAQKWLVSGKTIAIGFATYNSYQQTDGKSVWNKKSGETENGGHAVEIVGYGISSTGERQWIVKNSWGCNWANGGFQRHSWKLNNEAYFQGLNMDVDSYENDVTDADEPECETPEGEEGEPCATFNEFNKCILCNTGQVYNESTGQCDLGDESPGGEDDDSPDNTETVEYRHCEANGYSGWECPSDSSIVCQQMQEPTTCSYMAEILEYYEIETNCNSCPAPAIPHCADQNADVCLECEAGYTSTDDGKECFQNKVECAEGLKENISGNCVVPIENCKEGYTLTQQSGDYCKECNPGFENNGQSCDELPDPENCESVEMATPKICLYCKDGQDWVETGDENCYKVPDNCLDHSKTGCNECAEGYDAVGDGCQHRDEIEGCLVMNWGKNAAQDSCEECEEGYLNQEGICVEMTRDVDPNCEEADEWGWCVECAIDFSVTTDGGCKDMLAGPDHCLEHKDGVCSSCEEDFAIVHGKCKQEEEHENGCKLGKATCECIDGYTYNDDWTSCSKPEHCQNAYYGYCDSCPEGYTKNSRWTDCEKLNPDKSQKCAHMVTVYYEEYDQSQDYCAICNKDQSQSQDKSKCKKSPKNADPNCQQSQIQNGEYTCQQCNSESQQDQDQDTAEQSCVLKDDPLCGFWSSWGCQICNEDSIMKQNQDTQEYKCAPKDPNCKSYNQWNQCDQCDAGYMDYDYDKAEYYCVKGNIDGCAKQELYQESCQQCKSGYTLQDYSCV